MALRLLQKPLSFCCYSSFLFSPLGCRHSGTPSRGHRHCLDRLHYDVEGTDTDEVNYSFEVFPPHTDASLNKLKDMLSSLTSVMRPSFIDVTYGAGGRTRRTSMEVAKFVQRDLRIPCIMHLTCMNCTKGELKGILDDCQHEGICNILALRGDMLNSQWPHAFEYAINLVRFVRKNYGDLFGIAVAGYPETHPEAKSFEEDLGFLKKKCDVGAQMVLTQLFLDPVVFLEFKKRARQVGITQPIVPGIILMHSYDSIQRLLRLCPTTSTPAEVRDKLETLKGKSRERELQQFGVDLAVGMCKYLYENGQRMFHFYTLNVEHSIRAVLSSLQWLKQAPSAVHIPRGGKPPTMDSLYWPLLYSGM